MKIKPLIQQLAECKEFGVNFKVEDEFWEHLTEIVSVLKSSYNATIEMQDIQSNGLSDFYISWLRIIKNLGRIEESKPKFDLATKLKEKMELRAPSLFKTPLMLSAIYLDPRIMFKLSAQEKSTAAMDLIKIHERLTNDQSNEGNGVNDTLDEIQQEYNAQNCELSSTDRLLKEISLYETEKLHDIRAPVMDFWDKNLKKYELLRPIAEVLHTVPSNQSSVEKSFSSFSYIRSKYRMSMSAENLSNVLMIRLNKDVFYQYREEQIEKILG